MYTDSNYNSYNIPNIVIVPKNRNIVVSTPIEGKYLANVKLQRLDEDVFSITDKNSEKIQPELIYNVEKILQKCIQTKPKSNNNEISKIAIQSAERVTNDVELQKVLAELTEKEAIIIRTKKDATPVLKEQFESILENEDKENVIVLDINPQMNNGMQKSNTLISRWYSETNEIPRENLITLRPNELRTKALRPDELNPEWKQGSPFARRIEKNVKNVEIISMAEVREILDNIKGLSADEVLEKYSINDLSSVVKTMNINIIATQKQKGYIGALSAQLATATKDKDEVTVVIPDDCSLSGSSMLCDSVKIFDNFIKNNPDKKLHVVFSPLILGDIAQNAFDIFMDKDTPLSDMYLRQVSAIKADGTESYPGIRKAFERVKNSENITFEVTQNTKKAKHFTETDYFKTIEDPVLKTKLTYLMQGGIENASAQFGGFGRCGVLVITPTEEFELDGKTYAGKIPTNSVGYMEIVGHQAGVLNDEVDNKGKGVFTKGTGWGYSRYCEWDKLAQPESPQERIPITISADGTISVKK